MTGRRRFTLSVHGGDPGTTRGGFALVLVLWTLALLSVVVMGFAQAMRTESRLARNLVDRARANALAEAGIYVGIARLTARDEALRWPTDGTVQEVEVAGEQVLVAVRSERGKVDLNRGAEDLVRGLMAQAVAAVQVEASSGAVGPVEVGADADQLTDALLDWRDRNHDRRVHGAEDGDYRAAGLGYASRDGPFSSRHELTQLLGMTQPVYEYLAPLVTLYSGRPGVDPLRAPSAVLLAVPGLGADAVADYLEERRRAAEEGVVPPDVTSLAAGGLLERSTRPRAAQTGIFSVVAQAQAGDAVTRRAAVVRIRSVGHRGGVQTGRLARSGLRPPYDVLEWLEGVPPGFLYDPGVPAEAGSGARSSGSRSGERR